ncbi:MAG: hypothetical protein CVT98_07290 [Bacteroidetes bacterium HGW-Bacteroidetes-15]|nr:MAG: hypothetical protein CVT98_07290 [Bacteroidetes bacterium HGW-Bacteroidetes-15]
MTKFEHPDAKYTITVPIDWVRDFSKNALVGVFLTYDSLHMNKKIAITNSGSVALSLKEAYKTTMRSIKSDKKYTIESEGKATINGEDAMWAIYSFKSGNELVKAKIYVMRNGRTSYSIQAVLPSNSYESDIVTFDNVISTFSIK